MAAWLLYLLMTWSLGYCTRCTEKSSQLPAIDQSILLGIESPLARLVFVGIVPWRPITAGLLLNTPTPQCSRLVKYAG
jgi:hypothetical protein